MKDNKTLKEAIAEILNKYSRENNSNTPDYILAEFLVRCLLAYETAIEQRDKHGSNQALEAI